MPNDTVWLSDVPFTISHSYSEFVLRFIRLLQELFYLERRPAESSLHSARVVLSDTHLLEPPATATVIDHSDGIRVSRSQNRFYLQRDSAALEINPSHGCCQGVLTDDFWHLSSEEQRRFLLLLFVILMHRYKRFSLHANGVADETDGCLIVGSSGSGKTTLSGALLSDGWKYISDDAVFLRHSGQGIRVLPLNRSLSCAPRSEGPSLGPEQRKTLVDVDAVWPGSSVDGCYARVLLFPTIVPQRRSEVEPIDRTTALGLLIRYSAGIMADRLLAGHQLDVLKRLVCQSASYRFYAGRDVLDEPQIVSQLLRSVPRSH